jgi:hypothetical protein
MLLQAKETNSLWQLCSVFVGCLLSVWDTLKKKGCEIMLSLNKRHDGVHASMNAAG